MNKPKGDPTPNAHERERKAKVEKLQDAFNTLFRAQMGGTYARPGEPAFSGDAASIFVLASLADAEDKDTPQLVKVGWGEFSRQTFESDEHPAFRDFPYDIYCVPQWDSYLANPATQLQMKERPQEYLSGHSLFVANSGEVHQSEETDERDAPRQLDRDIEAVPYEDLLRTVRNQIITHHTTPEEFAAFLRALPEDPQELGKYIRDLDRKEWLSPTELEAADEETRAIQREKVHIDLMTGMGIETVGILAGGSEAMTDVLTLKQQFDFETNAFR